MPLLDGSEVGIRKGVPVAQINVPYPACCMCGESITDNLFTTTIKGGTMDNRIISIKPGKKIFGERTDIVYRIFQTV